MAWRPLMLFLCAIVALSTTSEILLAIAGSVGLTVGVHSAIVEVMHIRRPHA